MGKMVGMEGDGCAVPFQEYVDIDNDVINLEAPTEQEIIENLADVDRVGSSESDDQLYSKQLKITIILK